MVDEDDEGGEIAEHRLLAELEGKWEVECRYYLDPAMPPMQAGGEETVELLGEFWSVGKFETQMMGIPFSGMTVLGYEPGHTRWVCTRVNSISPYMYVSTGSLDETGKILTLKGRGPHPQTESMVDFRTTDEWVGDDERRSEMFVELPDGGEQKMFTYAFRRKR